jgi:hypothetical protein
MSVSFENLGPEFKNTDRYFYGLIYIRGFNNTYYNFTRKIVKTVLKMNYKTDTCTSVSYDPASYNVLSFKSFTLQVKDKCTIVFYFKTELNDKITLFAKILRSNVFNLYSKVKINDPNDEIPKRILVELVEKMYIPVVYEKRKSYILLVESQSNVTEEESINSVENFGYKYVLNSLVCKDICSYI